MTQTTPKPETKEQRLRRLRKTFRDIIKRYEKDESLGKGDIGFLIALIEERTGW